MNKSVAVQESLAEILGKYNTTEKMYLLAILMGYSVQEAYGLAENLGTDIRSYILKPSVVDARDSFEKNGWYSKKEVSEMWDDLICTHYRQVVMLAGIREASKKSAKDRDNIMIKEATKCANVKKSVGVAPSNGSYDQKMLREHR